jgi:hypothetical protein
MYPKWVEEVSRTPCGECHASPTIADIVAIGTARPAKREAYLGPLARVLIACPGCGGQMYITLREPIASVILAMREFVRLADETGRNTPPPFNFSKPKTDLGGEAATDVSEGCGALRPSRRTNQPDTPPTQQEIQLFLRRLKNVSFKRTSKGFNNWMRDMRADGLSDEDLPGADNREQT